MIHNLQKFCVAKNNSWLKETWLNLVDLTVFFFFFINASTYYMCLDTTTNFHCTHEKCLCCLSVTHISVSKKY